MSKQLTTYSAKDMNFTFLHPLTGPITGGGVKEKGITQVDVEMDVDQTVLENAMDGAVAVSVVPGDQGKISIQAFQTSSIHQQFLAWYNALRAARDAGDVSQWASGTIVVQNIVDGSSHTCKGVAPTKVPSKSYQGQAQKITWVLVACDITSE